MSLAGHSGGDSDRIEQESKEERIARNEGEARTMLRMRYDSAPGKVDGQERGLWMAAERWCRLHGREGSDDSETRCEGVTLVITHANGLHKEVSPYAQFPMVRPETDSADVVSNLEPPARP